MPRRACAWSACSATSARRSPTSPPWGRRRGPLAPSFAAAPGAASPSRSWTSAAAWELTTTAARCAGPGGAGARRCCPRVEGLPLLLVLEPGRSLVAAAGVLLDPGALREGGPRQALRDRGRGHERPAAAGALPGATTGSSRWRRRGRRGGGWTWSGPSARAATSWPATASCPTSRRASSLAVRDVGAYGFVMASNYNLRPATGRGPGRGRRGCACVRRRETFEDLVRAEVS